MPRFQGQDILQRGRRRKRRKLLLANTISPEITTPPATTRSHCGHVPISSQRGHVASFLNNNNNNNNNDNNNDNGNNNDSVGTIVPLPLEQDQVCNLHSATNGGSLPCPAAALSSKTPMGHDDEEVGVGVVTAAKDQRVTSSSSSCSSGHLIREANIQSTNEMEVIITNPIIQEHQDQGTVQSRTHPVQQAHHDTIQDSQKTDKNNRMESLGTKSILELSHELPPSMSLESVHVDHTHPSFIKTLKQLVNDCILYDKGAMIPEAVVAFLVGQVLQLAMKHPKWVLVHHHGGGYLGTLCLVRTCHDHQMVMEEMGCDWRLMYNSEAKLEYIPNTFDYNQRLSNMIVEIVVLLLLGIDVTLLGKRYDWKWTLDTMIVHNVYICHKTMWSTAFQAIMEGDSNRAIGILGCRKNATMAESYLTSMSLWKNDAWRQASMAVASSPYQSNSLPEPRVLFDEHNITSKDELELKLQQAKLLVRRYEEMLGGGNEKEKEQNCQSRDDEQGQSRILRSVNRNTLKPCWSVQSSPEKGNFVISLDDDDDEEIDSDGEWGYVSCRSKV